MANRSRNSASSWSFLSPDSFPPAVKWLLLVNITVYLIVLFTGLSGFDSSWFFPLMLIPEKVVHGWLWQLVTYAFVHASVGHLFWNALGLWMFGQTLERTWGTQFFMRFYMLCAVGAAVLAIIGSYAFYDPGAKFFGMSAAVLGLVVAFGFVFYDQTVLFSFVLPIKAQYMAMLIAALVFFSNLESRGGMLVHLGGMVTAFVYMYFFQGRDISLKSKSTLKQRYRKWKIDRARKKFQVYLRKNDPDRDRWVN